MELVGAALGHGVDEHAGEVALPHVRRRHHDAELLDRLRRDDLAAGPAARDAARTAEIEALALVGAVDGERVVAVVRAGGTGRAAGRRDHLRGQLDQVDEVTAERRHAAEQRVGNDAAHALPRGAKVTGARDADGQRLELDGLDREPGVHPRRGGEPNVDLVPAELLEAEARDGDRVGAADLESLNEVESVAARERRGGVAGRAVHHPDLGADYRLAGGVSDRAGNRAGGDALRADGRCARAEQDTAEQRRQSSPDADPHTKCLRRYWLGYRSPSERCPAHAPITAPADPPRRDCSRL